MVKYQRHKTGGGVMPCNHCNGTGEEPRPKVGGSHGIYAENAQLKLELEEVCEGLLALASLVSVETVVDMFDAEHRDTVNKALKGIDVAEKYMPGRKVVKNND
jgi:hypothetical protein